jgi:uroporphyrinogen decarboxylase
MAMRLLRALAGEPVWPPPVWLMRQAGRYLPEYRALRAKAGDFISLCTTPDLAAEVTLQPIRRFGMDAAILFSDILILPWALGWGLRFAEGEGPMLPQWNNAADTGKLDPNKLDDGIAPILQTVRLARAGLDRSRALIGFAGGPFTVACYMLEGGGSKDHARTRMLAYQDPRGFSGLVDVLTEATIDYLAAQIDAGADAVMLFDSWAGVLSPLLFHDYVTAPTARIIAGLERRFPHAPVIGFPRLAGTMLGRYAEATGVCGVGVDTGTDLSAAIASLPEQVALQGNLDPAAVLAGGEALLREAGSILNLCAGRPFIFNLGHGILPQTPPEHVAALIAQIRLA